MKVDDSEDRQDFVWRFSVSSPADEVRGDPLVEMVRLFLEDLQAIAFLTSNGEKISVDGFAFANNPSEIIPVFPDAPIADGLRQGESRADNSVAATN